MNKTQKALKSAILTEPGLTKNKSKKDLLK